MAEMIRRPYRFLAQLNEDGTVGVSITELVEYDDPATGERIGRLLPPAPSTTDAFRDFLTSATEGLSTTNVALQASLDALIAQVAEERAAALRAGAEASATIARLMQEADAAQQMIAALQAQLTPPETPSDPIVIGEDEGVDETYSEDEDAR